MTKQLQGSYINLNNGEKAMIYKVNNDFYGNPRYVIHYLDLNLKDYKSIAGTGFNLYRGKDFGGGYVFTSYSAEDTVNRNIDTLKAKYPNYIRD